MNANGISVNVGADCEESNCLGVPPESTIYPNVRVYRNRVPGGVVHISRHYWDGTKSVLAETRGIITFLPVGEPRPHPHNREALVYPFGEVNVADKVTIKALDEMIARLGDTCTFWAETHPEPKHSDVPLIDMPKT